MAVLKLGQFSMPETRKIVCLVNNLVYYARQTHEIYQVLPYSVDFKAEQIEYVAKKVVQIIAGVKPRTSTADLFHKLNVMKVDDLNILLSSIYLRCLN